MKFQAQYELPPNEIPTVVVSVIMCQEGHLFVVCPDTINPIGIISMLTDGIRSQITRIAQMEKEAESLIVKPNMKMIPTKRGRGRNGS